MHVPNCKSIIVCLNGPIYLLAKEMGWVYHPRMVSGCFNSLCPSDAISLHRSGSTLAQVMACCFDGTRLLPQPVLTYHHSCFVAFTWKQFHKKCPLTLSVYVRRLHFQNYYHCPHLPRAKEFISLPNRPDCNQETDIVYVTKSTT